MSFVQNVLFQVGWRAKSRVHFLIKLLDQNNKLLESVGDLMSVGGHR